MLGTMSRTGVSRDEDVVLLLTSVTIILGTITTSHIGQPLASNILFPFFDGLIPEGWLLDIAEKNWKLNTRDRMGLLLACCKDCIGAVSVEEVTEEDES